ncbi:MAG: DUF938 domain-containing protein [Ruegeria sp.]
MIKRTLPPSASVAVRDDGARLVAPSASKNVGVLCELLQEIAPETGRALELASGTGQHVSEFARRLPGLHWQPSEVVPERRASVDAYAGGLDNVAAAVELDATVAGWHAGFGGQDLIVLINLLHLISGPEAETLISEAALALSSGGRFVLYGPFKRAGKLTSDGDRRFHEALMQQDPEIGYKSDDQITAFMAVQALEVVRIVEMPANNLAIVAERT